jgi:hypothetical protein
MKHLLEDFPILLLDQVDDLPRERSHKDEDRGRVISRRGDLFFEFCALASHAMVVIDRRTDRLNL